MILAALHLFISFTYNAVQMMIFFGIWAIFIVGLFVVVRLLLSAQLNPAICNLIAFAIASSYIFQLAKLYGKYSAIRTVVLDSGPPVACTRFSWFINLLPSKSCSEYYEALHDNIFGQLNIIHVSGTLLSEALISAGSVFGEACGGFVQSFLKTLDWYYRFPAFILTFICLLVSVLAIFGYRFDLFYGLIRIDFGKQEVTRSVNNVSLHEFSKQSLKRKFVELERENTKPVLLVNELYQKNIPSLLIQNVIRCTSKVWRS